MAARRHVAALGLMAALVFTGGPAMSEAPDDRAATRDDRHDFDFEFGTWKTELKRRLRPLSGSDDWVEYRGTTVVRRVLDGRANLAELKVAGPHGRIEGVALRLYNPQTRQWSLNYASAADGMMTPPVVGSFRAGRGEFYADDRLGDRPIKVRFVIRDITSTSARFEQAFSADGGKSWEVNWLATDTLVHR